MFWSPYVTLWWTGVDHTFSWCLGGQQLQLPPWRGEQIFMDQDFMWTWSQDKFVWREMLRAACEFNPGVKVLAHTLTLIVLSEPTAVMFTHPFTVSPLLLHALPHSLSNYLFDGWVPSSCHWTHFGNISMELSSPKVCTEVRLKGQPQIVLHQIQSPSLKSHYKLTFITLQIRWITNQGEKKIFTPILGTITFRTCFLHWTKLSCQHN